MPNLNFDQHLEASALRDNLGEAGGTVAPRGPPQVPWARGCHCLGGHGGVEMETVMDHFGVEGWDGSALQDMPWLWGTY